VKNEIATIGGADSASGSLTDRHGGTIESDSLGGGHTRGARGSKWSPDSTNFAVAQKIDHVSCRWKKHRGHNCASAFFRRAFISCCAT
jgi:hypothetical protein